MSFPEKLRSLLLVALILPGVFPIEVKDFLAVNTLRDGEVETRIFWEGVAAKETTVSNG